MTQSQTSDKALLKPAFSYFGYYYSGLFDPLMVLPTFVTGYLLLAYS